MSRGFKSRIEDPRRAVAADLRYPGAPLLIAFGGFAGRVAAIPPFEFFRLTGHLQVNKAYLRDLDQRWYHAGLRGVTRDIPSTAAYLRDLRNQCRAGLTLVVGSSMGGYAALLFGSLIRADAVHAFSPHVSLADERSVRHREELRAVHAAFSDRYFHLDDVLREDRDRGERHIYFDATDRKDRRQIGYLEPHENLHFHPFPGGGHNLIKYLKAAGELERLLLASLEGASYEPRTDIRLRRSLLDILLGRRVA